MSISVLIALAAIRIPLSSFPIAFADFPNYIGYHGITRQFERIGNSERCVSGNQRRNGSSRTPGERVAHGGAAGSGHLSPISVDRRGC